MIDPRIGICRLNSVGKMRGLFNQPAIECLNCVIQSKKKFALPLADRMRAPEMGIAPQPAYLTRKVKFIEGTAVNEVGILTRYFISVLVFFHRLMVAGPLADPAHSLLVDSLEDVFSREAGADHRQHDLLPSVEAILPPREPGNATVASPVLAHRREVEKAAGQVFLLKVCLLLITPNDIPLGIAEEGVIFRT